MSLIIKIALTLFSWLSFLFLIIQNSTKLKDVYESMEPPKTFSAVLKPNVKILNMDGVNKKLDRMRREGPQTLHIITDFDRTLSKPNKSRKPVFSSLELFQEIEEVPEWCKIEMEDTWSRLDASLEDRSLSIAVKTFACQQALKEYVDRLKKLQIDHLPELLAQEAVKRIKLRDGINQAFSLLERNSVPVTILSAGLGNAIVAILQNSLNDMENVQVLGNFLIFKNGRVQGFTEDFIHIFNKFEKVQSTLQSKEWEMRQNIIVMGDALSDANMTDGAPEASNILKIGFLNHNVDKLMDEFTKTFDIVIVEDYSMDVVTGILKQILPPTK